MPEIILLVFFGAIGLSLTVTLFVFLSSKELSRTEFAFWGGVGMALISCVFRAGIYIMPILKGQVVCHPSWALIMQSILKAIASLYYFPLWVLIVGTALWIIKRVQGRVRRGSISG